MIYMSHMGNLRKIFFFEKIHTSSQQVYRLRYTFFYKISFISFMKTCLLPTKQCCVLNSSSKWTNLNEFFINKSTISRQLSNQQFKLYLFKSIIQFIYPNIINLIVINLYSLIIKIIIFLKKDKNISLII